MHHRRGGECGYCCQLLTSLSVCIKSQCGVSVRFICPDQVNCDKLLFVKPFGAGGRPGLHLTKKGLAPG